MISWSKFLEFLSQDAKKQNPTSEEQSAEFFRNGWLSKTFTAHQIIVDCSQICCWVKIAIHNEKHNGVHNFLDLKNLALEAFERHFELPEQDEGSKALLELSWLTSN